jgi:hypothetical protein
MESWIVVLFVIAALAGIVAFVVLRAKKKKREGKERFDPSEPFTDLSIELQRKVTNTNVDGKVTPAGAIISAATTVPDIAATAIDNAIALRIKVIQRLFPAWTRGLNASEYIFLLVEPDGVTPSGLPYLSVGGVMSAGTIGTGTKPMVLLPHFGGIGWARISDFENFAYSEIEHLTEYLNKDKEPVGRFYQFVGANDSHPHDPIPEDLKPRGLLAARASKVSQCGFDKETMAEVQREVL